jgi:plasmid stability protein
MGAEEGVRIVTDRLGAKCQTGIVKRATVATLHIKNFPDDLYRRIKERARRNRRTIAEEVVQLLEAATAEQPQHSLLSLEGLEKEGR